VQTRSRRLSTTAHVQTHLSAYTHVNRSTSQSIQSTASTKKLLHFYYRYISPPWTFFRPQYWLLGLYDLTVSSKHLGFCFTFSFITLFGFLVPCGILSWQVNISAVCVCPCVRVWMAERRKERAREYGKVSVLRRGGKDSIPPLESWARQKFIKYYYYGRPM